VPISATTARSRHRAATCGRRSRLNTSVARDLSNGSVIRHPRLKDGHLCLTER
jgi:hypothetical protein